MNPIDMHQIAAAIRRVDSMNLDEKVRFADKIHSNQPHALLTVLGLSQHGIAMPVLEHAIHVVMVVYSAFYGTTGRNLPVITLESLDEARRDNAMLSSAIERGNLNPSAYLDAHPEPNILSWVYDYLREHGLLTANWGNELLVRTLQVVVDAFAKMRVTTEQSAARRTGSSFVSAGR